MIENKPFRLAILGTRGIPARYGGFETFAEELAVRLAKAGIEVTVYCEQGNGEQPPSFRGVHLAYLPVMRCGPLTTVLFDLRSLWRARKSYDVVYLLGYGAAPFCFIPRLWGGKVWLNPDGIEWQRAKWGRVAKSYFKAMEFFSTLTPNRLIADAQGIRDHLAARQRRLPPCSVIPYGAPLIVLAPPLETLNEWNLIAGQYYLVVCRLEPENHVREIIDGFTASSSPYPLIIVGNHQTDTPYVRELHRLGSDQVHFIGAVYGEKLQALRYHALAYFHGHSVGGTNPSLLEAMGCGNLIVAHDNVFNREVLGISGHFFQSAADIPELVKVVESLSPAGRALTSAAVRDRIRACYNWNRITGEYLQLIKEDLDSVVTRY